MLRTASQSSGESAESPATAFTLYTPEAQRYTDDLVRTFSSLGSDISPPATVSAFDMSKLTESLRSSTSSLSATASSFTPINIFKSSKLAQLTAVSTPDVVTPATDAALQPGEANLVGTLALPAASDSDLSKVRDAPLGRPTRYVVVIADKPEHVKVLATITVGPQPSPNPQSNCVLTDVSIRSSTASPRRVSAISRVPLFFASTTSVTRRKRSARHASR